MNSHQRATFESIFEKPTRADIRWPDIEAVFVALGGRITEGKGSRVRVALKGRRAVFHRPHPQQITGKGALESVRSFLESAGCTP